MPAEQLRESEHARFGCTLAPLFVSVELLDDQRACAKHQQDAGMTKIRKCAHSLKLFRV